MSIGLRHVATYRPGGTVQGQWHLYINRFDFAGAAQSSRKTSFNATRHEKPERGGRAGKRLCMLGAAGTALRRGPRTHRRSEGERYPRSALEIALREGPVVQRAIADTRPGGIGNSRYVQLAGARAANAVPQTGTAGQEHVADRTRDPARHAVHRCARQHVCCWSRPSTSARHPQTAKAGKRSGTSTAARRTSAESGSAIACDASRARVRSPQIDRVPRVALQAQTYLDRIAGSAMRSWGATALRPLKGI